MYTYKTYQTRKKIPRNYLQSFSVQATNTHRTHCNTIKWKISDKFILQKLYL